MQLVIFDIDGTLTQTVQIDDECYLRSLVEVCGFETVETDWSSYPHATDPGILREIHQTKMGRFPSETEVGRFRRHFIELLTQASTKTAFAAVAGAASVLSRLKNSSRHRVSLATGAWRDSARLKMASAGLCFDDYPAASSDDAFDRETIVQVSRQRATERYGDFESVVYVGDALWDARACRKLSLPFIGIATGERAKRLKDEGAVRVFPDFTDQESFFGCLEEIKGGV